MDDKIIEAARAEFLEKGFRDASVHRIAARAGITTGALYTRYRNKDALFRSLVQPFLEDAASLAPGLQEAYQQAQEKRSLEGMLEAIRQEEQLYLDLLFRHHTACVLCFCRSTGSSLEAQFNAMMEEKARTTVACLRNLGADTELDLDGVGLLINSQFFLFRQILERGYSREKAMRCVETVEVYMNAGWTALFQAIF